MSISHTGMSSAMFRFSHCADAVGNVPSFGIAETGSWSPSPAIIFANTFLTKSGALSETTGGISIVLVTLEGIFTSKRFASV